MTKELPLPNLPNAQPLSDDDYRAFRSAFGGWAEVDTDRLKEDMYESRKSTRPRVDV